MPQLVLQRAGERLRVDSARRTGLLRSDESHDHAQFKMRVPPDYSRNTRN